jgi:hypothetical protein
MVESRFMKDMMSLNERLPTDVVRWSFEHGTSRDITDTVAFEKYQELAFAFSEIVLLALVIS